MNPVVFAPESATIPSDPIDLFALARSRTSVAALAAVHPELVSLEPAEVLDVGRDVTRAVLRTLRQARGGGEERTRHTTRLELLALALLRVHHEIAWPDTLEVLSGYDRLVARAEQKFRELDVLVAHLVRRGKIARGSLPRCARTTFVDRCERALLCVALLRDHGVFEVRLDLRATKALARRLLHARPRLPGELAPRETRDRAYTALCHALSERSAPTESGVFTLDDEGPAPSVLRMAGVR